MTGSMYDEICVHLLMSHTSHTGGMSVYERNRIQLAEKRKRKFSALCLPLKFFISILESGIRGSAVAPRTIYGALCRGKPAESEVFRGTLVKTRREASEGAHREEAEMFLDSVRVVGMTAPLGTSEQLSVLGLLGREPSHANLDIAI